MKDTLSGDVQLAFPAKLLIALFEKGLDLFVAPDGTFAF